MRFSLSRSFNMLDPVFKSGMPKALAHKAQWALAFLRQEVIGIAQDFWKDGDWECPEPTENIGTAQEKSFSPQMPIDEDSSAKKAGAAEKLWHAFPGEISERMWGTGFLTPGDEFVTDLLIKPFGINKDMSLLDLSAGLGGRMRRTIKEFKVYINGRESDPEIAARGMALSKAAGLGKRAPITPYDPMNWVEKNRYDCIMARETIYRVADKEKFIKSVVACCKRDVQISFTDYIVNPESHDEPAIVAWREAEKGADPVGLVEMAELWAKAGVSLRVHDDQTEYYKKEVKQGLLRFAQFMASGVKPDAETRATIENRLTLWAHRMAAFEQGMKFYRFYGLR